MIFWRKEGGELTVYSNEFRQFLSVIDPFFASRPPPADNMQISASNWNFTHPPPHYNTKTGHFQNARSYFAYS